MLNVNDAIVCGYNGKVRLGKVQNVKHVHGRQLAVVLQSSGEYRSMYVDKMDNLRVNDQTVVPAGWDFV